MASLASVDLFAFVVLNISKQAFLLILWKFFMMCIILILIYIISKYIIPMIPDIHGYIEFLLCGSKITGPEKTNGLFRIYGISLIWKKNPADTGKYPAFFGNRQAWH